MKRVHHEKRAARKECNTKEVWHGEIAPWKKRNTKRVRQSKKCNMKIVQHEQSIETEQTLEKVHKKSSL